MIVMMQIDGEWYVFNSGGYTLQSVWYYLDEDCKMARGVKDKSLRKWINSSCNAFDEHGRMYCDCVTLDGYVVNESGGWGK